MKAILSNSIEIYIQLLGDEEGTLRPTQAIPLGNDLFQVLPASDYEQADETWEFPPGSIVRCESTTFRDRVFLKAIEKIG